MYFINIISFLNQKECVSCHHVVRLLICAINVLFISLRSTIVFNFLCRQRQVNKFRFTLNMDLET
jgi:hypothetical protein